MPLAFAACVVASGAAVGREYAPRIVSPHTADAYSMKTFAAFPRWSDLKGDALAWEVYRYLTDSRTGLFPLGQPVFEGHDTFSEFRTVRDPVKLINVYGYGYCGILGPTVAGVCQGMGMGRARTLSLPGWHHVVGEVFYSDRWHYLDLDCRAAFRRPDGSLASMAESQRDDTLWKEPNNERFFPLDPLPTVRKVYAQTAVDPYYDYHSAGHTMDYVLRQGETFTRWWKPQGGRWLHLEEYNQQPSVRQLLEREPRGPKCKHPDWTIHTYGNGHFVYQPDLTNRSTDFEDGAYDSDNVCPTAEGLTLASKGRGHVVFEVRSPYVIVPFVGKLDTTADDREASVVDVEGSRASLALSQDNGLTWRDLSAPRLASGGRQTLDLTPHVSGTYGYLLKITLQGEPGRAVLRALRLTTWVQVAPASLPALRRGTNRMEYRTGDDHGLATRVVEFQTNGSDPADFFKYLREPPKDFNPKRAGGGRAHGPFIVKVQAPPHSRIAWLSAGGSFATHQQGNAKSTRNSMACAVDEPKDFQPFYQAEIPTDQSHWHYNVDREVTLHRPAKVVYLRYVGAPGVNNMRIYAHCLDDKPPRRAPVRITHAWKEDGALKTQTVVLERPRSYDITTTGEPVDESVELTVPSELAPR